MLPLCALIQDEILHEFWSWTILLLNYLEFVGNGIGMPMQSGNKIFENSGCLKFSHTENPREMLDQYYKNIHGQ